MWPLLVASLVVAAQPPVVMPEPAPSDASHERTRVVVLLPAAGDRRLDDVVASVRANLPPEQVELVELEADDVDTVANRLAEATRVAKGQGARGVFWFDLRDAREFRVYLHVPGRKGVLRRRVPEAADSVEAAIEAMWLIVRSGSLALSRGADVAMESVDPATVDPPSPPPTAPPTVITTVEPPRATAPDRPRRWWLALGYLGAGLARSMPWQSGATLGVRYDVHANVGIGVAYGVVAGGALREPTALRVIRHQLALALAVGGAVSPRVRLEARLLPALDLLAWRAAAEGRRGLQPAPVLAGELAIAVELVPRVRLELAPGLEVALVRTSFVRCGQGATSCEGALREVALTPWRVRPRARVGLALGF